MTFSVMKMLGTANAFVGGAHALPETAQALERGAISAHLAAAPGPAGNGRTGSASGSPSSSACPAPRPADRARPQGGASDKLAKKEFENTTFFSPFFKRTG